MFFKMHFVDYKIDQSQLSTTKYNLSKYNLTNL